MAGTEEILANPYGRVATITKCERMEESLVRTQQLHDLASYMGRTMALVLS